METSICLYANIYYNLVINRQDQTGEMVLEPLDELRKHRLEKLKEIEELKLPAFAYEYKRTHYAQEILEKHQSLQEKGILVSIAGRLMSIRKMGKASFGHVMDSSARIQIYIKQTDVDDKTYQLFKLLDIGDIIGLSGHVFITKTGEITIVVQNLQLLAKTLRPLPIVKEKIEDNEKIIYDAFVDKEMRYRQRYVDLIVNTDVKNTFMIRSKIISAMRQYLEKLGYVEVETPILQTIYGGAFARPFITHHHSMDMKLYLRIADELYLKRLIVGGFDGVFEIAKDFRNEGMDRDHNPEFTMMELYVAYEDYRFMMNLVQDMIGSISQTILKKDKIDYQGEEINLKPPWKQISFFEAIYDSTGYDLCGKPIKSLKQILTSLEITFDSNMGRGKIYDEIFSRFVEPKLIQPTFIIDYPIELSPLAKKHRNKKDLVERFETYIAGKEICNAFSELNDPIDQKQRFEAQAKLREKGDIEAMVIDEDFIRALEYGMPPTAGLGVGIDRLAMLLTDVHSIRDVILFPHMRPEIET